MRSAPADGVHVLFYRHGLMFSVRLDYPSCRTDFELLQRAAVPAFAPLLRKHLIDPECNTTELFFLLHAGLVVRGLLRGRVCPRWPLGEREGREGAQKQKAVCTWIWGNEPDISVPEKLG